MMVSSVLRSAPSKGFQKPRCHRAHLVAELRDERSEGNGWFVYLKPGFQYDGAHCFGEDRKSDVNNTMRSVKPCACSECMAALSNDRGAEQPQDPRS